MIFEALNENGYEEVQPMKDRQKQAYLGTRAWILYEARAISRAFKVGLWLDRC